MEAGFYNDCSRVGLYIIVLGWVTAGDSANVTFDDSGWIGTDINIIYVPRINKIAKKYNYGLTSH